MGNSLEIKLIRIALGNVMLGREVKIILKYLTIYSGYGIIVFIHTNEHLGE
jgi:hypothetical protein